MFHITEKDYPMDNAILETYYADMNARQDQNIIDDKAEEQARVSAQYRGEFVDEIASAYTAAKEGTPRASVYTAIGTIAGYFYNPEGNVIPRGDEGEANALSFQQRGMLGNLVSNPRDEARCAGQEDAGLPRNVLCRGQGHAVHAARLHRARCQVLQRLRQSRDAGYVGRSGRGQDRWAESHRFGRCTRREVHQ